MIFADKLIQLRKKNGWSQEDLANRLDVSRQTVSKWEGAQSIPDLNRILQLSELFGVSTDVLLKDECSLEDASDAAVPVSGNDAPLRSVSMEEANAFLDARTAAAGKIALGVLFCILSPIVLLALAAAQDTGAVALSENQAAGIGLCTLLLWVGAAVALFVLSGMRLKPFEYLRTEAFETAYGVSGMVREKQTRDQSRHTLFVTVGVVLCVVSCIPLFLAMLLTENELYQVYAVCVLLLIVAFGVYLLVKDGMTWGSYTILLQEEDYARDKKRTKERNERILGIYWLAVTAIYLAISFGLNNWDRSWIVWPVAGVGCAILAAILSGVKEKKD